MARKTVLTTDSGKRFVVRQETKTRNRHGTRKRVAKLFRVNETGNSFIEGLDSSLGDSDIAVNNGLQLVEELTGESVTVVDEQVV